MIKRCLSKQSLLHLQSKTITKIAYYTQENYKISLSHRVKARVRARVRVRTRVGLHIIVMTKITLIDGKKTFFTQQNYKIHAISLSPTELELGLEQGLGLGLGLAFVL